MIVERALLFDHQLSCTICHQLPFSLSLFKFFMIVNDSFSRLTTRTIVHGSFRSAVLVITGPIAVRKYAAQGCYLTNISGAQKGKSQKVRSPTGNVLGAAAKI